MGPGCVAYHAWMVRRWMGDRGSCDVWGMSCNRSSQFKGGLMEILLATLVGLAVATVLYTFWEQGGK